MEAISISIPVDLEAMENGVEAISISIPTQQETAVGEEKHHPTANAVNPQEPQALLSALAALPIEIGPVGVFPLPFVNPVTEYAFQAQYVSVHQTLHLYSSLPLPEWLFPRPGADSDASSC